MNKREYNDDLAAEFSDSNIDFEAEFNNSNTSYLNRSNQIATNDARVESVRLATHVKSAARSAEQEQERSQARARSAAQARARSQEQARARSQEQADLYSQEEEKSYIYKIESIQLQPTQILKKNDVGLNPHNIYAMLFILKSDAGYKKEYTISMRYSIMRDFLNEFTGRCTRVTCPALWKIAGFFISDRFNEATLVDIQKYINDNLTTVPKWLEFEQFLTKHAYIIDNNIVESSLTPNSLKIKAKIAKNKSKAKRVAAIKDKLSPVRGGHKLTKKKPIKKSKKSKKSSKASSKKSYKKKLSKKLKKSTPKKHKGPRGGVYIIKKGKKIYQ